jgi:RNA polymerase sigma-70 factor (ECF subfamily)
VTTALHVAPDPTDRDAIPPDRPSDAAVVRASLARPDRFAAVFDRHWTAVHAFCVSRAGAAGEDLAAETFRVAFDQRERYDLTYDDCRPWLYGIAANLVRGHFRAVDRGRRATRRASRADVPDLADEVIGRLEAAQLGPRLSRALAALPAVDRDTLLLYAWTELRYDDVARALGVPVGTVRSRLHRARARVQSHLASEEAR